MKARKMKNARKEQEKKISAVHLVSEQMEILGLFLTEAATTVRDEPMVKSICDEILSLLKVWDSFRYHTHETYFYRWFYRDQSIKGIRRVKAYLRNQVKLAFQLENGTSAFAEELKLLVVAVNEMQLHMNDMPFEGPPPPSQHLTDDELNRRQSENSLLRY
jgi:hypothetical protein